MTNNAMMIPLVLWPMMKIKMALIENICPYVCLLVKVKMSDYLAKKIEAWIVKTSPPRLSLYLQGILRGLKHSHHLSHFWNLNIAFIIMSFQIIQKEIDLNFYVSGNWRLYETMQPQMQVQGRLLYFTKVFQ